MAKPRAELFNLGVFFSPLVCGTLGQTVGWHWGFGAAGVGVLIGLAKERFFLMLTAIGLLTGLVFALTKAPIERTIGRHV